MQNLKKNEPVTMALADDGNIGYALHACKEEASIANASFQGLKSRKDYQQA